MKKRYAQDRPWAPSIWKAHFFDKICNVRVAYVNKVKAELPGASDDPSLGSSQAIDELATSDRLKRPDFGDGNSKLSQDLNGSYQLCSEYFFHDWHPSANITSHLMYWDFVLKGVKGMEDNSSAAWNGGKGPSWLVQHVQLSDQQFGFHPKLWHKKKVAPIWTTKSRNPEHPQLPNSDSYSFCGSVAHLLIWVDGCTFRKVEFVGK